MNYDPNQEVLKQIKESKRVGEYLLTGFKTPSNGLFSEDLGYGNSSNGNINQNNIDADSFLKNLHMKTTKKIVFNPMDQKIFSEPTYSPMTNKPVNLSSKERRSCNNIISSQDISSRFKNPNLRDPQIHIDYRVGLDTRHSNR